MHGVPRHMKLLANEIETLVVQSQSLYALFDVVGVGM